MGGSKVIIYYSGGRKATGNGEPENVLVNANVMLTFGYHITDGGVR